MKEAKEICKQNPVGFSAEQMEAYTTIGGTPFLDGEYTVFGEVEEGLDVVDAIQNADTDRENSFHLYSLRCSPSPGGAVTAKYRCAVRLPIPTSRPR